MKFRIVFNSLAVFLLLCMVTHAHAMNAQERFKDGVLLGVGVSKLNYRLYQDYRGVYKSFKKEDIDLYGPNIVIGRDWLIGDSLLLGGRGEFMMLDALKRYDQANSKYTSTLDGQVYVYGLGLRLGKVFDIKIKDIISETMGHYTGEFFFEFGSGGGSANLGRDYSYDKNGISERYKIRVIEKFYSRSVSTGFNLTNSSGGFIELRVSQVSTFNNTVNLKGKMKVAGGQEEEIDLRLKDVKSTPMVVIGVNVGKHW